MELCVTALPCRFVISQLKKKSRRFWCEDLGVGFDRSGLGCDLQLCRLCQGRVLWLESSTCRGDSHSSRAGSVGRWFSVFSVWKQNKSITTADFPRPERLRAADSKASWLPPQPSPSL